MNPTTKVELELSREKLEEFERLQNNGGFKTRKEMLNTALTLLGWAIRHAQAGHAVSAVDESADKYHQLDMPFLTHAAKGAKNDA